MNRKIKSMLAVMLLGIPVMWSQQPDSTLVVYQQSRNAVSVGNYCNSYIYSHGGKVYNMTDDIVLSGSKVSKLSVDPSGQVFATTVNSGGKESVVLHHLWSGKLSSNSLKPKTDKITDLCFSNDGKTLYVLDSDSLLRLYSIKDMEKSNKIEAGYLDCMSLPSKMKLMSVSPKGDFMALADDWQLYVLNLQSKNIEVSVNVTAAVNDIAFTPGADRLAVLTADGRCQIYDFPTVTPLRAFDALGEARCCGFHSDGKYLAVVTGDTRVALVNILNDEDRTYIDAVRGGLDYVAFTEDAGHHAWLSYHADSVIAFKATPQLTTNRTRKLQEELSIRMQEWEKRLPEESMEEYAARVNEETRAEQILLFEAEIATEMAGDLVSMSDVTLGSYNAETSMLTLNFNTMPSIYLTVPRGQLTDFKDPGAIILENTQFMVNANDEFELIYAEITNTSTGKKYVFNNLQRESLEFIKEDENFMPLDVMQSSLMDELQLQAMKEDVVREAIAKQSISEHTNIDVNTKVIPSNGSMDYQVAINYTVEEAYSAQEDYKSGAYRAENSNAAMAMLSIVKTAMRSEFAKYMLPGKRMILTLSGTADASRIVNGIPYDGCYGDLKDVPVSIEGSVSTLTVLSSDKIKTNEQLAFLRAVGVQRYILKNLPEIEKMDAKYDYEISVSEQKGSKYRRIGVVFTFVDAF